MAEGPGRMGQGWEHSRSPQVKYGGGQGYKAPPSHPDKGTQLAGAPTARSHQTQQLFVGNSPPPLHSPGHLLEEAGEPGGGFGVPAAPWGQDPAPCPVLWWGHFGGGQRCQPHRIAPTRLQGAPQCPQPQPGVGGLLPATGVSAGPRSLGRWWVQEQDTAPPSQAGGAEHRGGPVLHLGPAVAWGGGKG